MPIDLKELLAAIGELYLVNKSLQNQVSLLQKELTNAQQPRQEGPVV